MLDLALKLKELRKLVIISMFADDELMDKFVLKGGSALDIVYQISSRSSVDVDLSMEGDFEQLEEIQTKINQSLTNVFQENGYRVFDFKFFQRPKGATQSFWGGYAVEFKIVPLEKESIIQTDINRARKLAEVIDENNGKKITIDISKYEYCEAVEQVDLDGYSINVYTLEMIIVEKLRAICQQLGEYSINRGNRKTPRAKDFYDIYILMTRGFVAGIPDYNLVEAVFKIKNVPINLLSLVAGEKSFYQEGIDALKDTIPEQIANSLDFEECFDFVLALIEQILDSSRSAAI